MVEAEAAARLRRGLHARQLDGLHLPCICPASRTDLPCTSLCHPPGTLHAPHFSCCARCLPDARRAHHQPPGDGRPAATQRRRLGLCAIRRFESRASRAAFARAAVPPCGPVRVAAPLAARRAGLMSTITDVPRAPALTAQTCTRAWRAPSPRARRTRSRCRSTSHSCPRTRGSDKVTALVLARGGPRVQRARPPRERSSRAARWCVTACRAGRLRSGRRARWRRSDRRPQTLC